MKIDAHQHFWQIARGDYGWLTPDLAPIHRDFGPDDLAPLLSHHGIDATILVQAAPTAGETAWLLAIAERTPFVAGVVGWLDFDAPGALAELDALARNPLLVGVRPMVQDIADDDWLLNPRHQRLFAALAAHGLVFDALVLPRHVPRLLQVATRHPELAFVLDHLAKPPISTGAILSWQSDIAALARLGNVSCKMSGMVTEAAADWTVAQLGPCFETVLEAFGPARLIWGSDWPVVNLAGGYDRWRLATDTLLTPLPAAARAAILGGNAGRVYLSSGRGRRTC